MPTDYIIEIQLKKWNAKDPRNDDGCGTMINLHPIHEDEEDNCYFRRQASVVKVELSPLHYTVFFTSLLVILHSAGSWFIVFHTYTISIWL